MKLGMVQVLGTSPERSKLEADDSYTSASELE